MHWGQGWFIVGPSVKNSNGSKWPLCEFRGHFDHNQFDSVFLGGLEMIDNAFDEPWIWHFGFSTMDVIEKFRHIIHIYLIANKNSLVVL